VLGELPLVPPARAVRTRLDVPRRTIPSWIVLDLFIRLRGLVHDHSSEKVK